MIKLYNYMKPVVTMSHDAVSTYRQMQKHFVDIDVQGDSWNVNNHLRFKMAQKQPLNNKRHCIVTSVEFIYILSWQRRIKMNNKSPHC